MTGETSSPVIVIATIYSWMGWGIPRTPDDVTEHSQLTMQRFLEVLSSPDKQLVTSVMSGSQHTVHLLINNICIYAASNLTKFKLIDIYYNQIIQHNMGYIYKLGNNQGLSQLEGRGGLVETQGWGREGEYGSLDHV